MKEIKFRKLRSNITKNSSKYCAKVSKFMAKKSMSKFIRYLFAKNLKDANLKEVFDFLAYCKEKVFK